jgi:glycerophosphoryl diester phosphodiesterase
MKIIGHRGARGLAPENTMAGLRKAVEHGVDEVEFDLQVTKDGIVVLDHDGVLTDPNGQKRVIADYDYKLLKEHKPDLSTFREVLESDLNVPFYIEVKLAARLEPIIAEIKRSLGKNRKASDLMLASFNQKTLLELHAALPDIAIIVNEKWSGVRSSRRARQLNTKRVSMNQRWLWWGFIKSVHNSGWQLSAYTLNDPKKAKKWQKYGLYGVITDYPDLFDR